MPEYFIHAVSFAAPFVSDDWTEYVEADTPEAALLEVAKNRRHPAGLYAAAAYQSADAYHKGERPLAQWLCNHERAKQDATKDKKGYLYRGQEPGKFEIDGELIEVDNPKEGQLVTA